MSRYSSHLVLLLVTMMMTIIFVFVLFEHDSTQWITSVFNNLLSLENSTLFIALFIIAILAFDVVLPIPSSIVAVFAATTLGFLAGALVIWLGLMLGCCLAYVIGASTTKLVINRWISYDDFIKSQALADKIGTETLVVLRGVPVLAETSAIAAGLIHFPAGKFLLITGLANAGLALAYGYVGAQADTNYSFLLIIGGGILIPAIAIALKFAWDHVSHPQQIKKSQDSLYKRLITPSLVSRNVTENNQTISTITVKFKLSHHYPLLFENKVFNPSNVVLRDLLNPTLKGQSKVLIYIDSGVIQENKHLPREITEYFNTFSNNIYLLSEPITIIGGEAIKQAQQIELIYRQLLDHKLDRHNYVLVIGGGAVLDAVGYACATFHRGVKLLRMPSTVLAQNDAGIGVKNGINLYHKKNLVGTFAPPVAVLNDASLLQTLSIRDQRAGLAEAIKVAAIRDAKFFQWMETNVVELRQFTAESSQYAIMRCAQLHIKQITEGGDPFETGSARPLDYGHWSAHKLEAITNYSVRHGEAVAIGMALDARYAVNVKLLNETEAMRLITLLEKLGFNLWHAALDKTNSQGQPLILTGLEEFRQHLGGMLCITLLSQIGTANETNNINYNQLNNALVWLKTRANECNS